MKSQLLNKFNLNGAELICQTLKEIGVNVVFGIPGVHNLSLFEMLRRSRIRIVSPTHEQGAAFMANGYSRSTGKPGVFTTVPGPGLTNALTAIAEAYVDSTSVLGIITALPQSRYGYQIHEMDQTSLLKPISKKIVAVKDVSEIPFVLKSLWKESTTEEPGPVILQVASHLYWNKGDNQLSENTHQEVQRINLADTVAPIISRMASAQQVGFFIGSGVASASDGMLEVAEWLNAPVATTLTGRGIISETHPLSLGFGWLNDSVETINNILDKCDLVIALGTRFSQTGTHDYRLRISSPLIHIDASPQVLGQNYEAILVLPMDSGVFLNALLENKDQFRQRKDAKLLELIRQNREKCLSRSKSDSNAQMILGDTSLNPYEFFQAIQNRVSQDTIVVTDSGYNERLTVQNWTVYEKRTLLNPSDYESMGFGIPAAIGAAIAHPDRQVIVIVGDGGLAMSGLEILTIRRQKLNVKIFVLNNNGFGIIKQIQTEMFGASVAVDHDPPDYQALAKSVHIPFHTTVNGIKSLNDFLQQPGLGMMVVDMRHNESGVIDQAKKRWKNDMKHIVQGFLK